MPNNDLGTAHGKILIEFEDRGTAPAAAALLKIQKQFELLNQRVAVIEKSFKKNNVTLDKTSRSFTETAKSSDSLTKSFFGGSRASKLFDKDILDLAQDVTKLGNAFKETREKYKHLETAYKVLDRYQRIQAHVPMDKLARSLKSLDFNDFARNEHKVRSFYKSLDSVNLGAKAASIALWRFGYGHRQAMQALPTWTRYVHQFSLSLGALGVAGLAAGAKLNAGWITKFLNTGLFRKIVLGSAAAGGALERLGAISQKVFGRDFFGGFVSKLKNSESGISNWVKNLSKSLSGGSRAFNSWFKPVAEAAKQIGNFTLGIGLMSSGLGGIMSKFNWLGKIPKPLLVGLGVVISTVLPAAFQVLGKAIVGTSNIFMGLLSGVKQLSGGFLVLPGLLAGIGAAVGTVKTIFGGLADQLKDVFSDDLELAAEAFDKLPQHLKPMALALKDTVKGFKELRNALQAIAFKGVETQIKSISEKYLPLFAKGMSSITLSLRTAKDAFVEFLEQGQTQKDTLEIFQNTSQVIGNLKQAIKPFGDGLRDIATVGTRFISDMSGGAGKLATQFGEWARVNRESGQMLRWMQEGRKGLVDLTKGTVDLTKGLFTILTMFKSKTGAGFLDTYAAAMKRFNAAMKQSSKGGILFDFVSLFKGLAEGTNKIDNFKSMFQSFVGMMQGVIPAVQTVSNAFSSTFVPQIETAMETIGNLSNAAAAFNLDYMIGVILGLVAAAKLLPTFLMPIWNAARAIGGFALVLLSASKTIRAIESGVLIFAGALSRIPIIGNRVSQSLLNVAASASGLVSTFASIAGPLAAATVAIGAVWLVMRAGRQNAEEFDAQIEKNKTSLVEFGKALTEAFSADDGLVGKTVMDQVSMGMDTMIRDLEDTTSKAPGIIDHIADYFKNGNDNAGIAVEIPIIGTINGMTRNSDDLNRRQEEAAAADMASQKLRQLRKDGVDLETVIAGSKPAFDSYIGNLRTQGDEGKAAADVLIKQKNAYDMVYDAMQKVGPAGVQLANGIKKVAEAGGDATTKLEGLKQVLQGLGFLKIDAMEAAANYTTTLGSMGDRIREVIESGGSLNDVWDKASNTLNTQSELGAKLVPVFKEISDAYLDAANSGGNVDDLTGRLNASLDEIAGSLGTTGPLLKEFFRNNLAIAPEPIKLTLQLEGKNEFAQQIGKFLLSLAAQNETGVPVRLLFNSEFNADKFDKELEGLLGHDITDQDGQTIVIKPGIQVSEADLLKMQELLATYGIQTSATGLVDPAKIPVAVEPPSQPPLPVLPSKQSSAIPPWTGPVTQQFTPPSDHPYFPAPVEKPTRAPDFFPSISPTPPSPIVDQTPWVPKAPEAGGAPPALEQTSQKVDEVSGKMDNLVSKEHKLTINTDQLQEVTTKVDELSAKFKEDKLETNIEVHGVEKFAEVTNTAKTFNENVNGLFNTLKEQIQAAVDQALEKVNQLSQGIIAALDAAAQNARDSGSKFVEALAQGIESNPAAIRAAETLAGEIRKRFHQSPPKKGPLAAHGDAARYGGEMFVRSYARGIQDNVGQVGAAANSMAGVAAGGANASAGFNGQKPGNQQFFGEFLELTNFAASMLEIFNKVSDTMFKFAKFISDPMGKGTFFGQSVGFKKIAESERQRRWDDKDQQAFSSAQESAKRNDEHFQNQLSVIKNAETAAVSDQSGRKSQEAPKTIGALIKENFPEIASIGGARADNLPYHNEGRALDVMIPNYNTPEGKALGDRINAFMLANAEKFGVEDTIWQDYWQPAGGGAGDKMGNQGDTAGHYDHVHVSFKPGAKVDLSGIEMNSEELDKYNKDKAQSEKESALEALQERYGPPLLPGDEAPALEQTVMRFNEETGNYEVHTPHGKKDLPGPGTINPLTKKPWTSEESLQYAKDNPMEIPLPEGMTLERFNEIQNNPLEFNNQKKDDLLNSMGQDNPDITTALRVAEDPRNASDSDITKSLLALDNEIVRQRDLDTAGSRQTVQHLETIQSSIMDDAGYERNQNPIDQVAGIVSNAAGVASDIIGTVVTGIEAVGAADNIAKQLVRGVSGTKDVDNVIDNVQKFVELGGKIAGSVASVSGLAGSIAGAASAEPSGGAAGAAAALGSVSTIASLIQAGWETANAVIDLSQEAMRIAGGYVGEFLGYLTGGAGGQLAGDVKFLLDKQTNQLLTYSAENSLDKRTHNVPFAARDFDSRKPGIGNINVYGGPGSDPRDLTRQMMFQVESAQYAGALSQ